MNARNCIVCGKEFEYKRSDHVSCSKKCNFKKYTTENKEKVREKYLLDYKDNRERYVEKAKIYREKNREKINRKRREEYKKNPQKYKDCQKELHDKKYFGGNRETVLVRDDYTCQVCGYNKREKQSICVHHIDWDKTNNTLQNLTTLCSSCHRTEHNALSSHYITFDGITMNKEGWAERLGIAPNTLSYRLKHWTLKKALTTYKLR